ncbi:MAG: hypothetical protein ACRC33_04035 [Gemmataceae bacterium]
MCSSRKDDERYIYLEVTPKNADDRAEFQRARLVLDRKTFLPRQLWVKQGNANEVLWDMPRSATGVKLDPRYFEKPIREPGWKIVPFPSDAAGPAGQKEP